MTAPRPAAGLQPSTSITVYVDGPLIVRGDVEIRSMTGEAIDPGRRTIALCRCGRSAVKPFCDGAHRTSQTPHARQQPAT